MTGFFPVHMGQLQFLFSLVQATAEIKNHENLSPCSWKFGNAKKLWYHTLDGGRGWGDGKGTGQGIKISFLISSENLLL